MIQHSALILRKNKIRLLFLPSATDLIILQ
ncbi:hypothetical protein PM8797T_20773 [Gimesia maris DSM 8797]|nr:hypothetical protein PM8797T_20773 [Gimesia maris DSM 8797]